MARPKSSREELDAKKKIKDDTIREERDRTNMDSNLASLRLKRIGSPKYFYTVGEEVLARNGRCAKIIIVEILDQGKIVLAQIHSSETRFEKQIHTVRLEYLSHLEILPKSIQLNPKDLNQRKQRPDLISFHNTSLSTLIFHHQNGINYDPEYQRGQVWTMEDKQKLIASIFDRVSIGSFAFVYLPYSSDEANQLEILDGKQRLLTIMEFYEDRFQYKGFYFSELSQQDKLYFRDFPVTQGLAPENMTLYQKYDYFLRMNSGGMAQSEEHLNLIRAKMKDLVQDNS